MDKWLSHPTALKIISIFVALLLWAVVHIDPDSAPQQVTSSTDTKVIEAAVIQTEGLDTEKLALTAMEPTVVRLVVEGRISLLAANSENDYVVKVDLSRAKPGLQELPLIVELPKGIQLVEKSPQTVNVQLEEIVTKGFDLGIVTNGNPAEGYIAGTPTAELPTNVVAVTLPKDDMDRVGLVSTEVKIEGADKTVVSKKSRVVVYDKEGIEMSNATVYPETVQVEVKITPPFKTVPLQVRYTGNLPAGLSLVSIKPAIDKITVYGEQKVLDGLQVYDGVVLDLAKVKETGTIQVKTQLIDGIKIIEPAEVALDVVVAPIITRTFTGTDVVIKGVGDGLTALIRSPETGKIDLTLSGAESVLSKVKASDIQVIANLEGLTAGTHTISLEVDVPPYIQTVIPSGTTLTVTIEIKDSTAGKVEEEESEEVGGTPTDPPATEEPPAETTDPGQSTN